MLQLRYDMLELLHPDWQRGQTKIENGGQQFGWGRTEKTSDLNLNKETNSGVGENYFFSSSDFVIHRVAVQLSIDCLLIGNYKNYINHFCVLCLLMVGSK